MKISGIAGLPILAAVLFSAAPAALAQDKSQCQFALLGQLPLNYTGALTSSSLARGGAKEAARQWLDKAAAHGQPQANLQAGRRLFGEGKFADAAASLRLALDKIPSDRYGALWLYLARLQAGQPDVAKHELEARFAHDEPDEWPAPIADYYLGRIDATVLLDRAWKARAQTTPPVCLAHIWMGKLYTAQGKKEMAEAESANARTCQASPPPAKGA